MKFSLFAVAMVALAMSEHVAFGKESKGGKKEGKGGKKESKGGKKEGKAVKKPSTEGKGKGGGKKSKSSKKGTSDTDLAAETLDDAFFETNVKEVFFFSEHFQLNWVA